MTWTLVTGAAKGIGRAICLSLAERLYPLVVHYNTSEKEAQELVQLLRGRGCQAEAIQGDFSSPIALSDFIGRYRSRFPATKNLVNNVGNYLIASAANTLEEDWYALFQTNLHAPFVLTRALLPSLKSAKGNIINLGFAGAGYRFTNVHCTAYNISKNALWMLTRSLAAELGPDVRVNMVSLGHIENSVEKTVDLRLVPMRRLGRLDEVARAVTFLLEDASAYITGQNIEVSGGVRL